MTKPNKPIILISLMCLVLFALFAGSTRCEEQNTSNAKTISENGRTTPLKTSAETEAEAKAKAFGLTPERKRLLAAAVNKIYGPKGRRYVVKRGDTLIGILRTRSQELATELSPEQLRWVLGLVGSLNPQLLENPTRLQAGMVLKLPSTSQVTRALYEADKSVSASSGLRDAQLYRRNVNLSITMAEVAALVQPLVDADAMAEVAAEAKEVARWSVPYKKYTGPLSTQGTKQLRRGVAPQPTER